MLTLISIIEVLLLTIPILLVVAFITVAERKTMGSMQRRLGPNYVGYYGLLQAFADALKLILKEYISPTQANLILFFIGPIITLIFSLLGYIIVPFGPGLSLFDFNLGILYMLAVSSLSTYGILIAGWSANSKYAFLGSLRSTAQLISYELILSSAILLIVLLTGSLNLTVNIEAQKPIMYIIPLFPAFIIFFVASIAETNRAPFDLAEAESELVSGFMTEHSAVIFVFFFLAEYASIVLICILNTIIFLGGYLDIFAIGDLFYNGYFFLFYYIYPIFNYCYDVFGYLIQSLLYTLFFAVYYFFELDIKSFVGLFDIQTIYFHISLIKNNLQSYSIEFNNYYLIPKILNTGNLYFSGFFYGLNLGIKSCFMMFMFIWVRASFPRIRYDQLMSFCWTIFLPIVICFIIIVPCLLYGFDLIPSNITLL